MRLNRHWAIPLALAGGMAIGASLTLHRRNERRQAERRQQREDIRAWEGEGGSIGAAGAAAGTTAPEQSTTSGSPA